MQFFLMKKLIYFQRLKNNFRKILNTIFPILIGVFFIYLTLKDTNKEIREEIREERGRGRGRPEDRPEDRRIEPKRVPNYMNEFK